MNDKIEKTIKEIEEIQKQPFHSSVAAISRKSRVDKLHKRLDELNYDGERPPRNWNQLDVK